MNGQIGMGADINASQARPWPVQFVVNAEIRHRVLMTLSVMAAVALGVALTVYGWDYYTLAAVQRPFSPKHLQLKPSGTVGLKLGMLGFFLFALVYLYPLRKRWLWLARQGKAKHWLDFHMMLGLVAPLVISFHSAFKIGGFAGMAYWTMVALVISGLVGRYFYAQIPRQLDATRMTLKDTQDLAQRQLQELGRQRVFEISEVAGLIRLPGAEEVEKMSVMKALVEMVALDLARPIKVCALRWRKQGLWGRVVTLGGMLPTRHADLENAIGLVRRQAALSKRIVFLSKTERVFYLWHVVHRPFSLSFAVFVLIHVGVVVALGYF